jgi:hypothetical protein
MEDRERNIDDGSKEVSIVQSFMEARDYREGKESVRREEVTSRQG